MAAITPERSGEVIGEAPPRDPLSSPPPGLAFGEPDARLRRGPIRRVGNCLKDYWSSSSIPIKRRWLWVPDRASLVRDDHEFLNAHAQRLPFAQRLCVARRDVGIFGILADGGQD